VLGLFGACALFSASRNLEIYWIDAEGGAATLSGPEVGDHLFVGKYTVTNARNGFAKTYSSK
jgi:hypothetical protein